MTKRAKFRFPSVGEKWYEGYADEQPHPLLPLNVIRRIVRDCSSPIHKLVLKGNKLTIEFRAYSPQVIATEVHDTPDGTMRLYRLNIDWEIHRK